MWIDDCKRALVALLGYFIHWFRCFVGARGIRMYVGRQHMIFYEAWIALGQMYCRVTSLVKSKKVSMSMFRSWDLRIMSPTLFLLSQHAFARIY